MYQNQNFWILGFGVLGFGCSIDFNLVMENYGYQLVKLLGNR